MDLVALTTSYKAEQDPKKKFDILRKILLLSVEKKDPQLNFWLQEILKYKLPEVSPSSIVNCPRCNKMMVKSKIVKVPPRAEFNYYSCDNCGVERVVAYLTPYSKGVVHLRDISMYDDIDRLKKFVDSHYEIELKQVLQKISDESNNPAVKTFAQYKLATIIKNSDPIQSEKLFELSLPYYSSLKTDDNPELEEILQNLIVLNIQHKNPQRAVTLADQLYQHAEKRGNFRLIVFSKINKAIALEMMENYEESVDLYTDAMNISEENNYPDLFDQASLRLQQLLEKVRKKDEAEKFRQ